MEKTLYVIPTPIGNLDDISFRAIKTIEECQILFSEDTRVTMQLMNHLNLKKTIFSNHKDNEHKNHKKIEDLLEKNSIVGLISDRGTPLISDPGFPLINIAISKGYEIICLPGPTAFVPALVSSGISAEKFVFYGFLSNKKSEKKKELEKLKEEEFTIIFYESPHRIEETLKIMYDIFGDRKVSVSKEISKKYENTYRSTLSTITSVIENYKGEFVIVVEGNKDKVDFSNISYTEHVDIYLKQNIDLMTSIKKVAKERGVSKSAVYKEVHRK